MAELTNFEVPRAALMAWAFASQKDDSHPYLQTVRFESTDERVGKVSHPTFHAVASDGKHLIHVWWEPDPADRMVGSFEIEADAVNDFLAQISQKKGGRFSRGQHLSFRIEQEDNQYLVTSGEQAMVVAPPKPTWGTYVDWRKARFKGKAGKFMAVVDLERLDLLRQYLVEFNNQTTNVQIRYNGEKELDPIRFLPRWANEEEGRMYDDKISVEFILAQVR